MVEQKHPKFSVCPAASQKLEADTPQDPDRKTFAASIAKENVEPPCQDVDLCTLCDNMIIRGQACSECEEIFCQSCIEKWLLEKDTCPDCHKPYQSTKIPKRIEKSLEKKMVKCRNCPKTHPYNEAEEHDYQCHLPEIACILGCDNQAKYKGREKAIKHAHNTCPLMGLICNECKIPLKREIEDSHVCQLHDRTIPKI